MNRKMKRFVAAMLLCTMVCFTGSAVSAKGYVHECAFSNMGDRVKSRMLVSTHLYDHYNSSTEKMEKLTCQVYQTVHVDVYKCACGAEQERNLRSIVTHSACGQ